MKTAAQGGETNNPMIAFARIRKVDEEKRLVFGRATQEVPDRAGEKLDYVKSKPYFESWSKSQLEASMGKSAGNIRSMHGKNAAGIVTPDGLIFNDDERAVDIVVKVVDDADWKKVLEGVHTGFSIGGAYVEKSAPDKDGVVTYVGSISEISLVDRPALAEATFFEVHKKDGKVEQRKFAPPTMRKLVRRDGKELGFEMDARDIPEVGAEFEHADARYMLIKVENGTAYVDQVYDVGGTPEDLAKMVAVAGERGLGALAIADLIAKHVPAPLALDEADVMAKALQTAHDEKKLDKAAFDALPETDRSPWLTRAREELTKAAKEKEGVKEYGNVSFADAKNKKYPIDTEAHIRAAWSYINMPKNSKKYGADELASIKGKIKAAAKEKGVEINEKVDFESEHQALVEKLAKALHRAAFDPAADAVAAKANDLAKAQKLDLQKMEQKDQEAALAKLAQESTDALYKALPEDAWKASIPAAEQRILEKGLYTCGALAQLMESLCSIAQSCEYEAAMEGDGSTICDELYGAVTMLGSTLQRMVAEEVSEAAGDAEKAAMGGLVKAAEILKATHVAVSSRRVQKVHDMAKSMGAKCEKDVAGTAGTAGTGGTQGAAATHNNLTAAGAAAAVAAAASSGDLEKVTGLMKDAVETAVAPVRKLLEETQARLKKVEDTPVTPRVHLRAVAVSKADDTAAVEDPKLAEAARLAASVTPVLKGDGTIDEFATAIKMQLAKGGTEVNPMLLAKGDKKS